MKISEAIAAFKDLLRDLISDSGVPLQELAMQLQLHPRYLQRMIYRHDTRITFGAVSGIARILGYRISMDLISNTDYLVSD